MHSKKNSRPCCSRSGTSERSEIVDAYTKGYLSEDALDTKMGPLLSELQRLPIARAVRDVAATIAAAVSAGETLADMASYWAEATSEERRDMVWAMLPVEGLVYDLQRRLIAGILPRADFLPVLTLGLATLWEPRQGGLWRHGLASLPHAPRMRRKPPQTPPALTSEQATEALAMVKAGQSLRQVAAHFGVSHGAIWRLMRSKLPQRLSLIYATGDDVMGP